MKTIGFFNTSDDRPDVTPPSLKTTDEWMLAITWLSCNVSIDEFGPVNKTKLAEVSGLDKNYLVPLLTELCVRLALVRKEVGRGYQYKRLPLINRIPVGVVKEATKVRLAQGGVEPARYVESAAKPVSTAVELSMGSATTVIETSAEQLDTNKWASEKLETAKLPSSDQVDKDGCEPYYLDEVTSTPAGYYNKVAIREQPEVAAPVVAEAELPALSVVPLPADLTQYGFTVNSGPVIWCEDKADMQERVDGYLGIDGTVEINLVKRIGKVMYKPTVILDEAA